MGKEKYIADVERLFKRSPVVTAKSIGMVINRRKRVKQYVKQFIRNWILKGRIKRVAKGCYTSQDNVSVAVFCFRPSYLGLQDALSFHNLWEQETIPVVITARKVRPGIRSVMESNVLVRRLSERYLFGFSYHSQNGVYLPYSDVEKTFLDMVYFNEGLNKDIIRNIKGRIDAKKLRLYLRAYPEKFREKALSILK